MSPSLKKSKDKKASKEPQKASSKLPGPTSAAAGIPASAYNPMSGTFHALETAPTSSVSSLHTNGRFRNIDETDEHCGGTLGSGVEYDSVSNNGSWSGESEDLKEKLSNPPVLQETITGAPDSDRREKIRQKNEKKHQRQKERRAQELHDRISGFLMSRKLEALAQMIVAMGFSHERATMALMLNEGRVQESASWLCEVGEEADKNSGQNVGECNLKIDISEELAQIIDMEIRYKCTKQDVERAVVAAEGDLVKAAENLRVQKPDSPTAMLKPDEKGDPLTSNGGKQPATTSQNSIVKPQPKPNPAPVIQQRRDERDFNYTKAAVTTGIATESINRNIPPLNRIQSKLEWAKPQQTSLPAEKRWPSSGSNLPVSYSLASPLHASPPPAKMETRFVAVGNEYKNLQPGSVREPVIVMQRPQSLNVKQRPVTNMSSSPPVTAASWYPSNGIETMKSTSYTPYIPTTRSPSPSNLSSNQMYHQLHYQQQQQQQQHFAPSSPDESSARGNGLWSRVGASPPISPASSLGLFCGLGSSEGSSPVDWSTGGSMAQSDYASIDWSLDRDLYSARHNGLWLRPISSVNHNTQIYDSNINERDIKPNMRFVSTNGNGIPVAGFQDGGVSSAETLANGLQDWSSPFEEKDLFNVPRRFVFSPSL